MRAERIVAACCLSVVLAVCGFALAACGGSDGAPQVTGNASSSSSQAGGQGALQEPAQAQPVTLTVSAAGDCTLGTDENFGVDTFDDKYDSVGDPAYFFRNVKSVFEKDDLTIVNLEGPLTKRGKRADKQYAFRGRPAFTEILTAGSVEAVGFANNHDHDYGAKGFSDTIRHVRKAGIELATYDLVTSFDVKGVKVGLIAVNMVSLEPDGSEQIVKDGMEQLEQDGCAVRIVFMHAGTEGTGSTEDGQEELAHYAVDHGADLVLGSHPHVLQGVEFYKGVYIVYSLANFCFGGNPNPQDKDSMIFQKTFTVADGVLERDGRAKVIPCSISSSQDTNDYQPTLLKGSEKQRVISRVNELSAGFGVSFNGKGKAKAH